MQFSTCIDRLEIAGLLASAQNPSGVNIDRLAIDSREVGPSDCFVALRGASVDGHLFIDKAVKNGASAIVSEAGADAVHTATSAGRPAPAFAHVSDSHRALAELSSLFHSDPGHSLCVVATTGTNGKTTVATLLAHVLNNTGHSSGFIGTTGYRYQNHSVSASHTTPSPVQFYEMLSDMLKAGCTHCSMEASSHAIDQSRFRIQDVDTAVFTNLTRDHLDYHHTFEAYGASKKRLFDELDPTSTAVSNLDDPFVEYMVRDTRASVVTYGGQSDATIRYRILENELSGLKLEIDGVTSRFKLAGRFNAANLVAAYAASLSLGVHGIQALEVLAECPPVEGRMEVIVLENGTTAIVDYAHTPDALENVLSTVKQSLPSGSKLWCVFGCGGDRDKGKRQEMGGIAQKIADHVVVTSDNPRTEDAASILEDIRTGMKPQNTVYWIVDRREAIHTAAREMNPGDTLVIAGKGHETVQVIGAEKFHFDDREVAKQAFASIGWPTKRGQSV